MANLAPWRQKLSYAVLRLRIIVAQITPWLIQLFGMQCLLPPPPRKSALTQRSVQKVSCKSKELPSNEFNDEVGQLIKNGGGLIALPFLLVERFRTDVLAEINRRRVRSQQWKKVLLFIILGVSAGLFLR